MADFAELGAEGVNKLTDKYFDKVWDKASDRINKRNGNATGQGQSAGPGGTGDSQNYQQQDQSQNQQQQNQEQQDTAAYDKVTGNNRQENDQPPQSSVNGRSQPRDSAFSGNVRRRQKNRLPSPEGDAAAYYSSRRDSRRSDSFDKESEYSERVIRNYEAERSDPRRKAESVLSKKDLRQLRRDSKMSYANGGYGYGQNLNTYPQNQRPSSAQPPRSRYNDDDEYGSDYDERTGNRYRTTGRGYDDYDNDGRPYAREVIETERYRGPARDYDGRRQSYGNRNDPYGAGAVTQYRRSDQQVNEYAASKRSRSRGRRDRDRSDSRSRSRSRSRSEDRDRGFGGKIGSHFDTTPQGLGVGLVGAVVGGMAGRHVGTDSRHKNRDILLGALIGGLGANAAEHKWRDWSDDKKEKVREDEQKWEQRYDGNYGRSRSAMR